MNCIYRSIWNDKTGTFVAVPENAKSAGKKTSSGATAKGANACFAVKALALSLMLVFSANVFALPVDGVVMDGVASINSSNTIITQSSQNAAINWKSFSIGLGEAVRFIQPNSNSVALNRVTGADPSNIFGSLSADGKVFLVNPNGILFAEGAQINVGGLVASTLDISVSDFMAGKYQFAGNSNAAVLNQGTINAPGGYVALLGANVGNDGTIVARLGTVALAGGSAMTLDVAGDGLLNVTVSQGAVNALVQNGGMIKADGGQVLLTAMAAGDLLQSVVNNTGVIQAQTIENRNGTIMLLGGMQSGSVNVGGTLDASAPNGGDGGFIEASAAHVNIANDAKITTAAPMGLTGTFLIDPQDFTIGSAPGNNITGATLSNLLVTNSVVISTDIGTDAVVAGTPPVSSLFSPILGAGDIFVNEAVAWTAAPSTTTLTFNAFRDVNINAAITATNGNLVVCCGRDVNVNAAITTTNGSTLLSAGRDVNIVRNATNPLTAITATDGNLMVCAGRDVNIDLAPLTLTRGSLIPAQSLASLGVPLGLTLSGGNNGTGPGAAGGTVIFAPGTPPAAVTGPNAPVTIYYNPTSYATPTNYSGNFTLTNGATLTQYMLVFPDGANKTFDGTTVATFTGLKGAPAGVTLDSAGTANFDTVAVGADKTVTFNGFTLGGASAGNYAFANSCCGPAGGRTTASIIAALPPVPPVPPVVVLPVETPGGILPSDNTTSGTTSPLGEEMLGGEQAITQAPRLGVVPARLTTVVLAKTPAQLLSVAPLAQPAPVAAPVQPKPVATPVETPQIYVAPHRPRKQDRN